MSKANWVSPSEVELYFPSSPEAFQEREQDIQAVMGDKLQPHFMEWAPSYYGDFVFVYLHDEPVGMVWVDNYKKTSHLHGYLRSGYEGRGLVQIVVSTILKFLFNRLDKEAVLITIDPSDPALMGFARQWGFKFSNKNKDGSVYRLTKAIYERLNHV